MYHRILRLLNIKLHEGPLVRKLFTVQFFLGIATAFLFTSTLSMVLKTYETDKLPVMYMISAMFLFVFNRIYAHYDERLNSPRLLELVILFSAASILVLWFLLTFFNFHYLLLIIAAWYIVLYMLVGYGFWGMASMMFNVRESKRVFSIVGAGDIPAKILGYSGVSVAAHFMKPYNLLWVSIVSLVIAFFLMKRYQKQGFIVAADPNEPHEHSHAHHQASLTNLWIRRFFNNRLVMCIALFSLVSYIVFAFIDFAFLAGIKKKYDGDKILTVIAIFMAAGRLIAIPFKLIFSSRMIAKTGMSNALLVTPVILLIINAFLLISGISFPMNVLIFGLMVLLAEVLRSTIQEPVFFILFQPLKPHDRLRGHLVAKGYTMPFALLGVGSFLYIYMQNFEDVPINYVAEILFIFLFAWIASVYFIKKQYLQTLITSLKKGYFTGAELFLNDQAVIQLLINKTQSENPIEVVHALNLLERSGYKNIYTLLIKNLHDPNSKIREFVLLRIIANNMTSALPIIKEKLLTEKDENVRIQLVKAYYFLEKVPENGEITNLHALKKNDKSPALIGLLHKDDDETEKVVMEELNRMVINNQENKLMVLEIIMESPYSNFSNILKILLLDKHARVYKKAIEAVGMVKDFSLLNEMIEVAAKHKAFHALQRSVLHYGDDVFSKDNLKTANLPTPLVLYLIKAAGKMKGDHSTAFLFRAFTNHPKYSGFVIEAVWAKKSKNSAEQLKLIEQWVQNKIEQSRLKISYYNCLEHNTNLELLQHAIKQEIKHDLMVLLKGFALLYDRQKVDRVIELLWLDNKSRIYNAIEVLELVVPGKYFAPLNNLVELLNDIGKNEVIVYANNFTTPEAIIEDIVTDDKTNFNEWTRSVACYMLPKLTTNKLSLAALKGNFPKEDHLFNETRHYVLSMLK